MKTMQKPTFKLIIPNKPKPDGTYPLKLRVTFKRMPTLVTLPYSATREDIKGTDTLTLRPNRLVTNLVDELVKALNQLAALDMQAVQEMTPTEAYRYYYEKYERMKNGINGEGGFHLDFPDYMRTLADTKKPSTRKAYYNAISRLCDYLGKEHFDISELKSSVLKGFEKYLAERLRKYTKTIPLYIGTIRTTHRAAREQYNNPENNEIYIKNPFDYFREERKPMQNDVEPMSRELIQYLIDNYDSFSRTEIRAVDLLLLTFALQGMNMEDMLKAKAPENDILKFYRSKTADKSANKGEVQILIHPHIKPIYEKLRDPQGILAFRYAGDYDTKHIHVQTFKWMDALRRRLAAEPQFAKEALTLKYGSARHAYASISYSLGINKGIINDGLGHVDPTTKITDIYIKKDWRIIWEANRKVLDLFDWSPLA